ncbi:MAG: serine/threonine-protein kinase [Pyrinomonadaceae bacterium]
MANTIKNIGEVINSRWKITKPLTNDSGQAHTYKVQDLQNEDDKTECVIKLLKKINDKSLARFKREIEASLSLDHPNIVHVIDSQYEGASEPYLVMEFCSGGELETKKIKNLSLIEKLKMFESICLAIAHAHAQDRTVIHRDIKPSNIFLRDPKTRTPVVGDFGICFFEESERTDERLTELREFVGAKNFRPPEADFGIIEDVKPSFDVYSLGKLLYWFLSNGDILVREHYNHQRFDLRNNDSEQSIHLAYEIFDKSIREEPTERYKNATEMFEDVRKLLEFIENDARFLDCNIPQKCIFCKEGKYEFEKFPVVRGEIVDYKGASEYGIEYKTYDGRTWNGQFLTEYSPKSLIARCNYCGNLQQFRLNNIQGNKDLSDNWKNTPKAK